MNGNCIGCEFRWDCKIDPEVCKNMTKPVPTRADQFRALTDEKLAKFIRKLEIRGLQDSYCVVYSDDYCVGDINTSCTDCILKWLRQPAETEGEK